MNYEKLESKYPSEKSPCSDSFNGELRWKNQCAIRLSIALNDEGSYPINATSYSEPRCSHNHARGAESLANWLWSTYKPAFKYEPNEALAKITGRKGIVFIKDCFTRDGETEPVGDHIDVWTGDEMKSQPNSLFTQGTEVWLFTVS